MLNQILSENNNYLKNDNWKDLKYSVKNSKCIEWNLIPFQKQWIFIWKVKAFQCKKDMEKNKSRETCSCVCPHSLRFTGGFKTTLSGNDEECQTEALTH